MYPKSALALITASFGPDSGFSDSLIQDLIYSYLVLPNRVTVPLVGDVELAQLRFPMPKVRKLPMWSK